MTPELLAEGLREALVNAVAHRDYTIAAPIRVLVFDDRLEIRTLGALPNMVTLQSLPPGIHVLRNPMIYSMLLRVGLVTDAGSGIPRILRLTQQAGGRVPTFRHEGNEFVLTLPRKEETSWTRLLNTGPSRTVLPSAKSLLERPFVSLKVRHASDGNRWRDDLPRRM